MSRLLLVCLAACSLGAARTEWVASPNQQVAVRVEVAEDIRYSILFQDQALMEDMPLSLTLADGTVLGKDPRCLGTECRVMERDLRTIVPVKNRIINDRFREMKLTFQGGYRLIFRVYDDAVAYQWAIDREGRVRIRHEQVTFRFAADAAVYFPEEESFLTHSERLYKRLELSEIQPGRFCSLPALVDVPGGPKVLITEADLREYPGLYLHGTAGCALAGRFPAVALEEEQQRDRTVAVTKRADYIADVLGTRRLPWRVIVLAREDKDLLLNETVYKLAGTCELEHTKWIKPGKVAWDWWNANNLFGVSFRAGVNTATYKNYIDFAADHGIEYIILDEGWYPLGDLLAISPGMDMEELFAYAEQKGVGIILWVIWKTLDDQLSEALDLFERWGAAGIKVDFMQRDDQWMVDYYERIAREAAERRLLVDFHGSYSPKGLRRRFPNVLTREGVKGLENCKWCKDITPEHDVTLPFIRMVAGPMDYTPGAMLNGQGKNFSVRFTRPMSQGTRCHQLAMYVIYESPLQMLADSPSHYRREPECMAFLSAVPTVWERSIALDGRVGEYVVMARQSGEDWYIGAMTDGTARELAVDLAFLGAGEYQADIFEDGPNADRYGNDFARRTRAVACEDQLKIKMAPGGGWAARLTR